MDLPCQPRNSFSEIVQNRSIYHAAPLHYLPSILKCQKLICAESGKTIGISPRKTAHRRDKMLGVEKYVHFYFELLTPLLTQKLENGMPHCVLEFDGAKIYKNYPSQCALLPFNTKAWRSRADIMPESDPEQMARILVQHFNLKRYPSLEFLVRGSLSIRYLKTIIVFSEQDSEYARKLLDTMGLNDTAISRRVHTQYSFASKSCQTYEYLDCFMQSKMVYPWPKIEFD